MGERQRSLNPTGHRAQTLSQLGTIPGLETASGNPLLVLPVCGWGLLWAVLALRGMAGHGATCCRRAVH